MPCRPEALRPRLSAAPTASCSLAAVIPTRLASLLDSLRPLAERFSARDHRLYLVGGSVRDLLLGGDRLPEDLDFTTDASPEQIKATLGGWADALWTQGERFGTIGAMAAGVTVEITTHRAEVYHPESRKPEVTFSADVVGARPTGAGVVESSRQRSLREPGSSGPRSRPARRPS